MLGKIYAIYFDGEIVVVGSTKRTLDKRWSQYKNRVKDPKAKSNTHTMMRKHGTDNYEMELLEEVEVENKYQMFAIEGTWQEMFENLGIKLYNTRRARGEKYGSPEALATKREKIRERRSSPEFRARDRERERERYREIGSQRIQCELCGRSVTRKGIRRHQSSDYCLENRPKTSVVIRLKK